MRRMWQMMDKTFAYRRQQVVREAPMIADFKTRWPALFHVHEVCVELKRIKTIHLELTFFSELDAHSADLIQLFAKTGRVQGRRIRSIMVAMTETDEDPEKLVKEYLSDVKRSLEAMAETVFGVFVIRHHGAGPSENPEDVRIILEGVKVLNELRYVPFAVAVLLALVYALNRSYPRELKYTFEALQKIKYMTELILTLGKTPCD
ncbi:uncharacterized protein LOC128426020 [Pleuronectes platessa]|uniref:uncharacterized protein LOC128426020 n=1 Tax=Pleuronectes platessa TaxID=8262 RepID=UPI00232A37E5|nr:uncharacterized protein LOC128426020 [Pleuronectes platessa]